MGDGDYGWGMEIIDVEMEDELVESHNLLVCKPSIETWGVLLLFAIRSRVHIVQSI